MELKPWGSQGGFHGGYPLMMLVGLFQGKSHLEMDKRTGGTPIDASWFIKILWKIWMMTGGSPMTQESSPMPWKYSGISSWDVLALSGNRGDLPMIPTNGLHRKKGKWWHPYTSFGLGGPCLRAALQWCVIFCDGEHTRYHFTNGILSMLHVAHMLHYTSQITSLWFEHTFLACCTPT